MSDPSGNFNIQGFNITIDASTATLYGTSADGFTADVTAYFNVPYKTLSNLFRFSSDAFDITDASNTDIKYLLNYRGRKFSVPVTTPPNYYDASASDPSGNTEFLGSTDASGYPVPLSADWLQETKCTAGSDIVYTGGTAFATNTSVTYEYPRYIAYNLFNTWLGVDLFNNEEAIRNDLNIQARTALNNTLVDLYDLSWCDASYVTINNSLQPHPSSAILHQIMKDNKLSDRLNKLNGYFIPSASYPSPNGFDSSNNPTGPATDSSSNDDIPVFNMPIIAGDVFNFKLTINAATDQISSIFGAVAPISKIDKRTYKIQIKAT